MRFERLELQQLRILGHVVNFMPEPGIDPADLVELLQKGVVKVFDKEALLVAAPFFTHFVDGLFSVYIPIDDGFPVSASLDFPDGACFSKPITVDSIIAAMTTVIEKGACGDLHNNN